MALNKPHPPLVRTNGINSHLNKEKTQLFVTKHPSKAHTK